MLILKALNYSKSKQQILGARPGSGKINFFPCASEQNSATCLIKHRSDQGMSNNWWTVAFLATYLWKYNYFSLICSYNSMIKLSTKCFLFSFILSFTPFWPSCYEQLSTSFSLLSVSALPLPRNKGTKQLNIETSESVIQNKSLFFRLTSVGVMSQWWVMSDLWCL